MKQLLPDEDRVLIVEALVHLHVLQGGERPERERRINDLIAKCAGTDKRIWVDDVRSLEPEGPAAMGG
jgi:hypothetical protein